METITRLPTIVNLVAYRGDTWTQPFRLLQDDQPMDLSEAIVKSSAYNQNRALTVDLPIVIDPDPGVIILSLPTDIPYGAYRYDIEIVGTDDSVITWIRGDLQVEKDVTNAR